MGFRLKNIVDGTAYPLTGLLKQVGRGHDCDIVLSDLKVSRLHARLEKAQTGWAVVDLESTNGTMVNGTRVKEKLLAPGDVIGWGSFSFKFEETDESDPADEATRVEEKAESTGLFGRLSFWKRKR